MITTSIIMVFADHMDIYLLACFRPLEGSIPMTADVILAMTGERLPASHPILAPRTDLQHPIKLMRLNGTIGLK